MKNKEKCYKYNTTNKNYEFTSGKHGRNKKKTKESYHQIPTYTFKKGGFIAKRHDNIKYFLTILLNKVYHDVQSQPQLIPVTNEHMRIRIENTNDQSRLDIKAKDFLRAGQK